MKDALRTKIDVLLTAVVAFAAGLGVAGALDLPAEGRAAVDRSPPELQIGAPRELAQELEKAGSRRGFADVAEHISRAVVTIRVDKEVSRASLRAPHPLPSPFDDFFDRQEGEDGERRTVPASGSGFLISRDGHLVTNHHVIENADHITVTLWDQREFDDVEVVGSDPTTDVALLNVNASELEAAPLGKSQDLRVGEWVLAVGSPGFGGREILPSTVTAGIVSAKGRNIGILSRRFQRRNLPNLAIEDFIQTDAVINQGNSGGPLVNARGEVVGMNTAILSDNGFYQGYGFAVPIDLVREVIDDLSRYGEARRAVLGVLVDEVTAADARYYGLDRVAGAQIVDFSGEDSPAREAGVKAGDVVVSVDGQTVRSVSDLQRKIRAYEPGETVRLEVVGREERAPRHVSVELEAAPTPSSGTRQSSTDQKEMDPLGVEVIDLTPETRRQLEERMERDVPDEVTGVVVVDARRGGPLLRAAGGPTLGENPIVEDINGKDVSGLEEYRNAVADLAPGDVASVRIFVPDTGQRRFLSVEIPEG